MQLREVNTKLPLGAVFADLKSSKQDLLVCSLIEGRIGWRHRSYVLGRIYF